MSRASSLVLLVLLALLAATGSAAAAAQEVPVGFESSPEGYLVETPAGAVMVDKMGYALIVDYSPGDAGQPGDEQLSVANTLSFLAATIDTRDNPFFDGPTMPVALDASLRSLSAPHPGFDLLREADESLLERVPLPADADIGEDGVDVGAGALGREGDTTVPWMTPQNSNLPLTLDEDSIDLAPSWDKSVDELLDESDRNFLQSCARMSQELGVLSHSDCAYLAAFDDLKAYLPDVLLHQEFPEGGLAVNPVGGAEVTATLPAMGLADAAVADGLGASSLLGPVDEVAPGQVDHFLGDVVNPSPGALADGPGYDASSATLGSPLADDALLAVLVLAAGVGLVMLAIPLYRRIVRGKVLENDVRGRILALVQVQPGLHESAVAQQLQISHTLAQYHVRMLAEFGLVEVKKFGGRKCLFAAGQMGRSEKTMLLAEKGRSAQVVDLIAAQPGIAQRELARALGIRESSVKWHLDRLEQSGVVTIERGLEGKRVRLSAEAERTRMGSFTRAGPAAVPVPGPVAGLPAEVIAGASPVAAASPPPSATAEA